MCINTGANEIFIRNLAAITDIIEQDSNRWDLRDYPGYNKAHKDCATVISEDD